MSSASYNYYVRVELSLITLNGLSLSTATYSFLNKSMKDSISESLYWPILTNVGQITRSAGDPLPTISIGSFTIRNDIGSFGANRKFSDVFQRYTPIEQAVTVYIGEVENESDSVSSWTTIAKGKCVGYQVSIGDQPTVTFDVQGARMTERILTMDVDRSMSGMTNAPDSSLGRTVPLIIGDENEVIPIRISADGATIAQYAYGTCYYQFLKNLASSPTPEVYTKNDFGYWELINNNFSDRYANTPDGYYNLEGFDSQAHGLDDGTIKNGLITGIKLRGKGNGLASSTALLTVFLLKYDPVTYNVIEEVATGRQALAAYDADNIAKTNPIPMNIAFDEPVFLSNYQSKYSYAIAFKVTNYTYDAASLAGDITLAYYNATADILFTKSNVHANSQEWHVVTPTGGSCLMYDFHMVTFTFSDHISSYNAGGFSYSKLQISTDPVDTNQVIPPFDNVPILIGGITGLSTYGAGTPVQAAQTLVDYLSYSWSTLTGWVTNNEWDTTVYNTRYQGLYNSGTAVFRERTPQGVFDSRTTFTEFVTELCRGTASKVGIFASGKLFMYPWGQLHTPVFNIPAGDITPVSWRQAGIETVINRIKINTKQTYLYGAKSFENATSEGRTDFGYQYSTDFNAIDMAAVEVITRRSRLLFGDRAGEEVNYRFLPVASTFSSTYLGGSTAEGSILAEYALAKGIEPAIYTTFVLPYHRYKTLEMFDVITFAHPDFPSFYGSNSEGEEPVYEDSSTGRTNLIDGYEWVRAETYRGQVEEISILLPLDHAPALKVTVRLITNTADIT